MRLLLIPVGDALPAAQDYLRRNPEDLEPPGSEGMRELVEVACRFALASEVLLRYAVAVAGRPAPN